MQHRHEYETGPVARLLPHTPKAHYRFALSAFFFAMGTVFASWAIRIPDVKRALGLSDAQLGGVLFASPLGELVSIAPSAWLIGRLGSRKVIVLAMTAMPLSLIGLGLAGSIYQLFAALFCFGLFNNMLNIALNAQAVGVEWRRFTACGASAAWRAVRSVQFSRLWESRLCRIFAGFSFLS